MKRYTILLVAAACVILNACFEKEEEPQLVSQDQTYASEITITADHAQQTKTSLVDGGTEVLWNQNDRIWVYNGRADAPFSSLNEEPARVADFHGALDYFSGDTLVAVFPFRKDITFDGKNISVPLPYSQEGVAGSFSEEINLAAAQSTSLRMSFKNICGGVRFTVSRNDICRISLEGLGEEKLAGRLTVAFEEGVPCIKDITEESTRIILSPSEGDVFEPGQWYYMVMAPGTLAKGVRMTFTTLDGLTGVAESANPLTVIRSVFAGKKDIDANVQQWTEEELETAEETGTLTVELPSDADEEYMMGLKLSNFMGDFPLFEETGSNASPMKRRSGVRKAQDGMVYNQFTVPYGYVWNNFLLQMITNDEDEMVMCCLVDPSKANIISAESTALGILQTTPYLISDDPDEIRYVEQELKALPEFKTYVASIQIELEQAMRQCRTPDFSKINKAPVILAMIQNHNKTPDSIDGLDLIDINRDLDKQLISLKVRNTFRRVIHIYGFREFMTDHGTALERDEPVGMTLSQVLREVTNSSAKDLFEKEDIATAEEIVSSLKDVDTDIFPMPYMLEPVSADYWDIVWGTLKGDRNMPAEKTTGSLDFSLEGAENLRLDIYGIGELDDLNTYSADQWARMLPVLIHGAIIDFVKPAIKLCTGANEMTELSGTDDFKYDLRYGARKAPMAALLAKLQKNWPVRGYDAEVKQALRDGDIAEALFLPVKYVAVEIFGNKDSEDRRTYHNLIYNWFKNTFGIEKMPKSVRDFLKNRWNEESHVVNTVFNGVGFIGATIKVSEAGVDLLGAIHAAKESKFITTFRVPLDENPHLNILSPGMGAYLHGDKMELSWDVYLPNVTGGVDYELALEFHDGASVAAQSIKGITGKQYTLDLSSLKSGLVSDKLKFELIARKVSDGSEVCRTNPVTVFFADYIKERDEAVDLGVSVNWASSNLGTDDPMGEGGYYGWGETNVSKRTFSWQTYQHTKSGNSVMSKYNMEDGLVTLLPEDDAVYQLKGDGWRIPTIAEWSELQSKCEWLEMLDDGVRVGYNITNKKTGDYIYLPCLGAKNGNSIAGPTLPRYWSSTRQGTLDFMTFPSKARALSEFKYGPGLRSTGDDRYLGMPLRGVMGGSMAPPQPTEGEMVDLGLSVKWATCNIGASSPRDIGGYYAWGELAEKTDYSWATYAYSQDGGTDMKKYNGTDNLQAADAEEDIVHATYGGNWRMPTLAELNELREKCTWVEIKEDDVLVCYHIISNINNKSIYLPVGGYKDGRELRNENVARYWTGTRNDNAYPHKARALNEIHFTTYHDGDDRCLGMPVRGVYDDSALSACATEYVDLGLSVKWASANIGATAPEFTGNRYAWGSLESTGGPFTWAAYRFSPNDDLTMDTYNGTDDWQYLKREDDVVYQAHQDPRWRTPTLEEWNELRENCTWTNSTMNGRRGYLITSNINGNAIFLPIAGYMENMQLKDGMQPRYWSSTRNDNAYPHKARALNEIHFTTYHDGDDRCLGMPVRGVYDETFTRSMVTYGEMVDLGLSVKWASHNIGTTVPEEAGGYYAWGELTTKDSYGWQGYQFSPTGTADMSIYNGTDDIQFLKREDDIAYQSHTGNGDSYWRIPTLEEWQELQNNCTWEFKIMNGRRGYKITSNKNGNSIFLPIAGLKDGTQPKDGTRPRYWSSTRNDNAYPHKARALNETHFTTYHDGDDRYLGMTVRAVYDDSFAQKYLSSGVAIDMGLSVKWAPANMGASLPEESGDFYAWGELVPKTVFTWGNYQFSSDGGTGMSKYHETDDLQLLERENDVVYQKYKGKWRMPTKEQWDELWNNCDQEIVRKNGRRGYLLTSKINGNSIFLPIAGLIDGAQPKDGMRPRYWSSTRNDNAYPYKARSVNEIHFTTYHDGDDRYLGMPIRAIFDDYADDLTAGEMVDLGLSVKWANTNMGAESPEETGNYYAWGETEPKADYSWATYYYSKDGGLDMTRYNGTDNIQYADSNDDVVHAKKGGDWRMPTLDEWNELREKCTWVEQVRNGRKGYKITSTINGNSIFLPIAGLMDGTQRKDGMRARYWSINRNDNSYPHKARALNEIHFTTYHDGDDRCLGMPVRGVYDDSASKMLTSGSFVDMGLSVQWASSNHGVSQPEYAGNYYAWGELDGKITYTWETYRFSADGGTSMSKYNATDNLQELELNDDIIRRRSNGASRMPTLDEWNELRNNCDWIFKIKNGRPGYVLVSKINQNAIFLPVVGYMNNEQVTDGNTPHYWSSTRNDNAYPHKARALNEIHFTTYHDGDDRCLGMPLRGVRE